MKTKVATHTICLHIARNVFNYFTYLFACLYYAITHFSSFTLLLKKVKKVMLRYNLFLLLQLCISSFKMKTHKAKVK